MVVVVGGTVVVVGGTVEVIVVVGGSVVVVGGTVVVVVVPPLDDDTGNVNAAVTHWTGLTARTRSTPGIEGSCQTSGGVPDWRHDRSELPVWNAWGGPRSVAPLNERSEGADTWVSVYH